MKTYPAILRLENGTEVLAIKNKCGIALSYHKDDYEETFVNNYYEDFNGFDKAENITREYLANTYGEVKSKEHADFLIKLAEKNKIKLGIGGYSEKKNYFYFTEDEGLLYLVFASFSPSNKHTSITIPLPPKEHEAEGISQLERSPYQGGGLWKPFIDKTIKETRAIDSLPEVEPTKIFTREEIGGKELEVSEGGICQAIKSSTAIHELESQGYKFTKLEWVSPNASKEPEPKEWPQVGDEVLTASKQPAVVLAINSSEAWVRYSKRNPEENALHSYSTVAIATLTKPPTPEEELTKELEKMVYDGMDNSYDLNHNCYYLVSGLMSKYDIKKKPE